MLILYYYEYYKSEKLQYFFTENKRVAEEVGFNVRVATYEELLLYYVISGKYFKDIVEVQEGKFKYIENTKGSAKIFGGYVPAA